MFPHSLQQHQQARFSAAAPRYDQSALIQRAVADRLFQGLAYLGNATRALDIGCGTGQLSRRLAATWPNAFVLGIDHAPGMIEEARRLNEGAARPVFETADALRYRPAATFDLVVSSSTLHWMQPLERTMNVIAGFLEPGGSFAFALMLDGTLQELHEARLAVAPECPPLQRMPSEASVINALRAAGLRADITEVEEHRIHAPTARELVRDLRNLGVTGGPLSRGARPLKRAELDALFARYDERYRDDRGVYASYRVGYAWGVRHA